MSLPRQNAYKDFLALAMPHARRVLPPPLSRPSDEEELRRAFGDLARGELAVEGDGWHSEMLFELRKLVETAIHLGKKYEPQCLLLHTVARGLVGARRLRTFSDAGAWDRVLSATVDVLNRTTHRDAILDGSREQVVAGALRALESRGHRYVIDDQGARLSEASIRRTCASIERKIARAGGLHTANAMLALMGRIGRIEDGSLLHARTPTMTGLTSRRAGTPWHYIYNLALKHFEAKPKTNDPQGVLTEMEELATHLAAALNVELHSHYENMTIGRAEIERIVRDTTVYDELFGMAQWQPRSAEMLVGAWLTALEEAGCAFPVLGRNQWASVASSMIAASRPGSIEPIAAGGLRSSTVTAAEGAAALGRLSAPTARVNTNYATPFDTAARTG